MTEASCRSAGWWRYDEDATGIGCALARVRGFLLPGGVAPRIPLRSLLRLLLRVAAGTGEGRPATPGARRARTAAQSRLVQDVHGHRDGRNGGRFRAQISLTQTH